MSTPAGVCYRYFLRPRPDLKFERGDCLPVSLKRVSGATEHARFVVADLISQPDRGSRSLAFVWLKETSE